MTNPISDEYKKRAKDIYRQSLSYPANTQIADGRLTDLIARALMAERDAALEEAAKWHEDRVKHWRKELDERRSWGGPTIGAEECINAIEHHAPSATAIRNMKVKADE